MMARAWGWFLIGLGVFQVPPRIAMGDWWGVAVGAAAIILGAIEVRECSR